ncbi:MAG TPA: hypothetical protein VFF69_11370 [Phycisphaerales bacterium]|nr:hypothetical protein [Phycisphaerales bacterium]
MASRLYITWLVILGLLLGAPLSHALPNACCGGGKRSADVLTAAGHAQMEADDCCRERLPEPPAEVPTDDEPLDAPCDCPLCCCAHAGSFGVQLPPERAGLVPSASVRAAAPARSSTRSVTPSFGLMRPPRS